jgi:hypothetical protein
MKPGCLARFRERRVAKRLHRSTARLALGPSIAISDRVSNPAPANVKGAKMQTVRRKQLTGQSRGRRKWFQEATVTY